MTSAPAPVSSPSSKPPVPASGGRRVCMLAYTFYESDNRVLRYASALRDRGDQVDVIALSSEPNQPAFEVVEGVNVHRIQGRVRNEQGKFSYLSRLLRFCVKSTFVLAKLQFSRKYDLVHVHNVPDFLVFSAIVPRLAGARVILDIHDILPEFFANKFRRPETSGYVKALRWLEFLSARFANHVIISNHLWYDKFTARAVPKERCSVFINHVETDIFSCRRQRPPGKFIFLYHGGLQAHQGLDIAIRAFARAQTQLPDTEFHIYGGGNMKPSLEALVAELKLQDRVFLFEPRSMRKIAQIVADADAGIVAKRADSFGNEAYSTKIMEFMASGVPVIVSRTKIDTYYFTDQVVKFFTSGNDEELAQAMVALRTDESLRRTLAVSGTEYVTRNSWDVKKHEYLGLVDRLLAPRGAQSAALVEKTAVCSDKA